MAVDRKLGAAGRPKPCPGIARSFGRRVCSSAPSISTTRPLCRMSAPRPHRAIFARTLGECRISAIDRSLLTTGRFAIAGAAGVFQDGTPFAIPEDAEHPPPLELPENTRNVDRLSDAANPAARPAGIRRKGAGRNDHAIRDGRIRSDRRGFGSENRAHLKRRQTAPSLCARGYGSLGLFVHRSCPDR